MACSERTGVWTRIWNTVIWVWTILFCLVCVCTGGPAKTIFCELLQKIWIDLLPHTNPKTLQYLYTAINSTNVVFIHTSSVDTNVLEQHKCAVASGLNISKKSKVVRCRFSQRCQRLAMQTEPTRLSLTAVRKKMFTAIIWSSFKHMVFTWRW